MKQKLGLALSLTYLIGSAILVPLQGQFDESFISDILGLPWNLALSYFEFFNASGALFHALNLLPIAINACIIYKIGSAIEARRSKAAQGRAHAQ